MRDGRGIEEIIRSGGYGADYLPAAIILSVGAGPKKGMQRDHIRKSVLRKTGADIKKLDMRRALSDMESEGILLSSKPLVNVYSENVGFRRYAGVRRYRMLVYSLSEKGRELYGLAKTSLVTSSSSLPSSA